MTESTDATAPTNPKPFSPSLSDTPLRAGGVPVADDYSETFTATMAAVLLTGPSEAIVREAAYETKGLGRSATQPPCEATIVREVPASDTPDSRPGVLLAMFDRKAATLQECLALRLRKGAMPYPQTAVFDGLPASLAGDETLDLAGTVVQRFADGFDTTESLGERELMILPRMDGPMRVERRFRTLAAVTGGMFLIYGRDDGVLDAALAATDIAHTANQTDIDEAGRFTTAKCAASGSKVGGINLTDMVATTNHRCCPSLRDRIDDSQLPPEVSRVYEIIVSGPTEAAVRRSMRAGIARAAESGSVVAIGTANYGGKLGSGQIPLRDLVAS